MWDYPQMYYFKSEQIFNLFKPRMKKSKPISKIHTQQELNYQYVAQPIQNYPTSPAPWKEQVTELIKDEAWEIGKDLIGLGLVGLGTWLLNPVGPEDWLFGSPLNPIDEIVGIGLIWTGRFIMWA